MTKPLFCQQRVCMFVCVLISGHWFLLHPECRTSCSWAVSDSSPACCQRMCFLALAKPLIAQHTHLHTRISYPQSNTHRHTHWHLPSVTAFLPLGSFVLVRESEWPGMQYTHTQRKHNPSSETHLFSVIPHLWCPVSFIIGFYLLSGFTHFP